MLFPYDEKQAMEDLEYVAKKLDLTKDEFLELMKGKNKTYKDYKNNAGLINAAIKMAHIVGMEKRQYR